MATARKFTSSWALSIAGDTIVGGVGAHEQALPTPERVDLRGRCVLPAFTDSHVHFPTWSLARRDVQQDGDATLDEALGVDVLASLTGDPVRGRTLVELDATSYDAVAAWGTG